MAQLWSVILTTTKNQFVLLAGWNQICVQSFLLSLWDLCSIRKWIWLVGNILKLMSPGVMVIQGRETAPLKAFCITLSSFSKWEVTCIPEQLWFGVAFFCNSSSPHCCRRRHLHLEEQTPDACQCQIFSFLLSRLDCCPSVFFFGLHIQFSGVTDFSDW